MLVSVAPVRWGKHCKMTVQAESYSLWTVDVERQRLTDTMFATIHCEKRKGGCDNTSKAVFRGHSDRCPLCGVKALEVSSFNQRNALVADATERFALQLFQQAINSSKVMASRFFVKRNVVSPQLEMRGATAADLAILSRDTDGPVSPNEIECILEVKMSVIWNWAQNNKEEPIADYDGHAGRPSIYRTDSILKAIGKAAIMRSCPDSERIPFIVVGNTPPPPNYRDKVDGTVKAGLIQKWISLTPTPLIVEPAKSIARRNPKRTTGFLRIDSLDELKQLLEKTLMTRWLYVGAMVEPQRIGEIIKSLNLSRPTEEIGHAFLKRLPEASSLYSL